MDKKKMATNTKALLYWLRHNPVNIGLAVDGKGWADVGSIVERSGRKHKITLDEIKEVIENDEKKKFEIEGDFKRIRAKEGHTISVDI
jgi:putative RNA 2'-phosphotransferase